MAPLDAMTPTSTTAFSPLNGDLGEQANRKTIFVSGHSVEEGNSGLPVPAASEPHALVELRQSLKTVYRGPDLLRREYEFLQEARRLNMDLAVYRHFVEIDAKGGDRWVNRSVRGVGWLLESAVALALVVAIVQYVSEAPARRQQAQLAAWSAFNSAQDSGGGRTQALQALLKSGASLTGLNAAGAYLAQASLANSDLSGANLQGATLTGANLSHTRLEKTNLHQADLRASQLQSAKLGGAKLHRANLSLAQLQGADLLGAQLQGSNLQGANLQAAQFSYPEVSSLRTSLERANLSLANLERAMLYNADLRYVNLQGSNLQGADLRQADLRGVNTQMLPPDADNASTSPGKPPRAVGQSNPTPSAYGPFDLTGAKLEGADLRGANLSMARGLSQQQLRGTRLDWQTKLPPKLYNPRLPLPATPNAAAFEQYWLKGLYRLGGRGWE